MDWHFKGKEFASGLTNLSVEKILRAKLCKCTKKLTSSAVFFLPRSERPLQTSQSQPQSSSGSRTFFHFIFHCFWIADLEAVSRSAALLLRIKA